jgi:anthranilate synthase/phosphoribosyltransferase
MVLLIDNYDSFSYNLYQLVGGFTQDIKVIRNDEKTAQEILDMGPSAILLSPGPGKPADAGVCEEVILRCGPTIPILGVCLGHQAICEAFGGTVTYAKELMHGKQSLAEVDTGSALFDGVRSPIPVGRYHSLAAMEDTLPECLKVTARSASGEVMAVEHDTYPIYGLQFHPESILTPDGKAIMQAFLRKANVKCKERNMIREAIIDLSKKQDLTYATANEVMNEIMGGEASPVQMSAFLTALSLKGETIDEITACAHSMRSHCIRLLNDQDVLEIVGTGGDRSNSFNISTTSSFVISAAGVPVAKHGNRAASSKSGAADVLEALGANITVPAEKSKELLASLGMCFLFAQNYHIAMKYVAPVRKELGIRTVFNILGPLANPAGASMQLMGVYEEALVAPLAQVMSNLGVKDGMVVFGQDGLDEISMSSPTTVCEVRDKTFTTYEITPEQFGFARCRKEELAGGTPQENADITRAILDGQKGPKRDAVLLNSAAALYIAHVVPGIAEGVALAAKTIDSGKAKKQMERFVAMSNA